MGNKKGNPQNRAISAREEIFCQAYCTIGSSTWSNATKSKEKAAYSERTMGSAIFNKGHIRARIDEILKELLKKIGLSPEKVLLGIISDQECARNDGQWSVSNQCSKLLGETYAMFSERLVIANRATATPDIAREDMLPSERERFDAQQAATDAACEAYKLALAGAGVPIERGRDNMATFVPTNTVSEAPAEPTESTEQEPEQTYVERIPAALVGKGQGRQTHSKNDFR